MVFYFKMFNKLVKASLINLNLILSSIIPTA